MRLIFFRLRVLILVLLCLMLGACASRFLKYEKAEQLKKIEEFDQQVKIVDPSQPQSEVVQGEKDKTSAETAQPKPVAIPKDLKKAEVTAAELEILKKLEKEGAIPQQTKKKSVAKKSAEASAATTRRQPLIEDDEGFDGRRPLKDPFRVGEKIVHTVSWSKIKAGFLSFETKPFIQVNGKKSYQYQIRVWSNSFFSSIYSVDDKLTSLVDFDSLVPSVFTLHVEHTSELKEARAFFDEKNHIATYWEKRVTKEDGEKEKKIQWSMLDYSQNVYSALFYLRNFQWKVGQTHQFRVADNNENLIFRAKAIRKEKIETDAGSFDTIVIQPQVELKGVAKQVGDFFIWLSDDDRKYILRIESKIKVGTFVTEVSELDPGQVE